MNMVGQYKQCLHTYNSKSSSSENKMTLEDIEEILSTKGNTQRFEVPYKAFNAGKTDIQNHKESIFITEVFPKKEKKEFDIVYLAYKKHSIHIFFQFFLFLEKSRVEYMRI